MVPSIDPSCGDGAEDLRCEVDNARGAAENLGINDGIDWAEAGKLLGERYRGTKS